MPSGRQAVPAALLLLPHFFVVVFLLCLLSHSVNQEHFCTPVCTTATSISGGVQVTWRLWLLIPTTSYWFTGMELEFLTRIMRPQPYIYTLKPPTASEAIGGQHKDYKDLV